MWQPRKRLYTVRKENRAALDAQTAASELLTLYTTPVIYLTLDRLRCDEQPRSRPSTPGGAVLPLGDVCARLGEARTPVRGDATGARQLSYGQQK